MKLLPNILWGVIRCRPLIVGGCGKNHKETAEKDVPQPEDLKAKQALQGIWTDEETETVAFYAKGDSIYYPDTTNVPVRFYIWKDTLYLIGGDTVAYPIDKRGPHIFDFHSSTGEIVKLVRSEDPNDSLYFTHKGATTLTYNEVVKKDTVVLHDGELYHCYEYVNPSRKKVYKKIYT
ncbi:MAG: DUF4738 domain-containing protein, partial [Paraprevotella sp.]|nr:DUF4738 domain-containing protein [Paraprevotella sp.]